MYHVLTLYGLLDTGEGSLTGQFKYNLSAAYINDIKMIYVF